MLVTISIIPSFAQTQLFPPHKNWQEIETGQIRVIYPQEMEEEALLLAEKFLYLQEYLGVSLNSEIPKWPVILNNDSLISNAFVTVAPHRSEWYSVPFLESDLTIPWYDLLAIHEGRHIYQFAKVDNGLIKLAHLLFGQYGQGAMSGLNFPAWFYEGDAVLTETLLSQSGRGRSPSFEMAQRAILLEGKDYNYDQAYLGSFNEYIPNHYVLGYILSNQIRRDYGLLSYEETIKATTWMPLLSYSMDMGSLFSISTTPSSIYYRSMLHLFDIYTGNTALTIHPMKEQVSPQSNIWTKYTGLSVNDNKIYSLQSELGRTSSLAAINTEEEPPLLEHLSSDVSFDMTNGQLVRTEISYNPKWSRESYSNIILSNIKKGQSTTITTEGRYFLPHFIGPDNNIISLYFTRNNTYEYRILDQEGHLEEKLRLDPSWTMYSPTPSNTGRKLVFVRQKEGIRQLVLFDRDTDELQVLLESETEGFRHLYWDEENSNIYYSSPYSGIDNIYVLNTETHEEFRVTDLKYGGFNPLIHKGKLYFIEYKNSDEGYVISAIPTKDLELQPKYQITVKRTDLFSDLQNQEPKVDVTSINTVKHDFKPTKYNSFKDTIIPHSWTLTSSVVHSSDIGFFLYGDDLFQNYSWSTGPLYDQEEEEWGYYFNLKVNRLYPHLYFQTFWGERNYQDLAWNQLILWGGLDFPLELSKGENTTYLDWNNSLAYVNEEEDIDEAYFLLSTAFQFQHYYGYGNRRLTPQKGFILNTAYKTTSEGSLGADRYLASIWGSIFLPGIFTDASTEITGGIEKTVYDQIPLDEVIPLPYGYTDMKIPDVRIQSTLRWNVPLFYPNWNFLGISYLKRISTTFYAQLHSTDNYDEVYPTLGNEMHMWIIPGRVKTALLDLVIRTGYAPQKESPIFLGFFLNGSF